MRGFLVFLAILILSMVMVTNAAAEPPDCAIIIDDLNQTLKQSGKFDLGRFLVKHGLEYTTCPISNGQAYCFKCLYKGSVSAVEITMPQDGSHVSPPRYGCPCQRSR